jgi:hypothetical protein
MDDFGCPACASPALAYPTVLEDDEPVACTRCGEFVSTYAELKQRSKKALGSYLSHVPVSGC